MNLAGAERSRRGPSRCAPRCWSLLALLLTLAAASGCGESTTPSRDEAVAKLKEKKIERPFEDLRVFSEPNELSSFLPDDKQTQRIVLAAKPGHWAGLLVQARANLFDVNGRLENVPQNSLQQPIDLPRSNFWLATSRGISLPKQQRKVMETLFFPPRPPEASSQTATWVGSRLTSEQAPTLQTADMVSHMPSFQYYWLVLAGQPDRYRYLLDLPSVRPPAEFLPPNVIDTCYYRILFPRVDKPLALARNSLCWTSTACVLWDNVLPGRLVPEQQRALADWLHWGGMLFVSGPESLDTLKGSFLEPYLPATGGTAGPIGTEKLAALHRHWTIAGDNSLPLGSRANAPWSGVELIKRDDAEFLPGTGELVVQGRVGRGRIVVTAFRLSEPELTAWPSFDSFVNACLLGRLPRAFDSNRQSFKFVGNDAPHYYDPAVTTAVRFFCRDETEPTPDMVPGRHGLAFDASKPLPDVPHSAEAYSAYMAQTEMIDLLKGEPGLAAWNDQSWVASLARETLREAAGISVPRRQFVFKMIGLYLLVVVPVNWLVFRLLGRVEWAWFAVPVVAVAWALLVVWLAQLDIGFARAQTEVAVLELQPNYPRGHLTRYTALYTSLASSYELRFEDSTALALPFPADRLPLYGEASREVRLATTGERDLSGYPVASNATGMIHSEQMFDLGGGLTWHTAEGAVPSVENNTSLTLSGTAVLRCREDEQGRPVREIAWLGDLPPGKRVETRFIPATGAALGEQRERSPISTAQPSGGGLSLRKLIDCAQELKNLRPGDVRLVAWHGEALPGVEVIPAAPQSRGATLIVVHLAYGGGPPAEPDENLLRRRASAAETTSLP